MVSHFSLVSTQKDQLNNAHKCGLTLCEQITIGIKNNVPHQRIFEYCNWFCDTHIFPQFEIEEKIIFPFLEIEETTLKKLLSEHRKIKRLMHSKGDISKIINQVEELLELHIRFENKFMFQDAYSNVKTFFGSDIQTLFLGYTTSEEWKDTFWLE